MSYTIHLSKEKFKFSGCHFTIFSQDTGERLHGHNYYVSCKLTTNKADPKLGLVMDFNVIKPHIEELCQELDEFVLIAENSPYLSLQTSNEQVSLVFGGKTYIFPQGDVKLLPLVNISSEELAKYLSEKLFARLKSEIEIESLSVNVRETQGQSVEYQIAPNSI